MPTTSDRRRRAERHDAGDTLVEVLVAVAVLGIGVAALLAALGVMVTTTIGNRSNAHAESALLSAAEYAKSMAVTPDQFVNCYPLTLTLTTEVALASGFTGTIGPGSAAPGSSGCSKLMQLQVRVQGDGFNLTLAVVRRR